MAVRVYATPTRAAGAVAALVVDRLSRHPSLVLGLPTGHTPIPLYRALVRFHRRGRADFARATTFNLDEFLGVGGGDAESYRAFMQRHFFDHVNLAPERCHLLDGRAADWRREVARFEARLNGGGGLDLVIVGIGGNGHLGFNEPAGHLEARTHRVRLHLETRRANAALFGGNWRDVPTYGLSMGIGTILQAREVMLLATGADKARVVARALTGPITTRLPASLLQVHPNLAVILDRAAASELAR